MIQAKETVADREKRLVLAAQAGSQNAVAELVEMHTGYVWREAKRVRCQQLETEDLVQIGMIALMQCIQRFNANYGVRLLTYAGRSITQAMWKAATECSVNRIGGTFDAECSPVIECHRESPVEQVSRREEIIRVRQAVDRVPDRYRSVLVSRMRGDTLEAIGTLMGISKERVRQLETVAREHLIEGGLSS